MRTSLETALWPKQGTQQLRPTSSFSSVVSREGYRAFAFVRFIPASVYEDHEERYVGSQDCAYLFSPVKASEIASYATLDVPDNASARAHGHFRRSPAASKSRGGNVPALLPFR
jgi:hypothetical protein